MTDTAPTLKIDPSVAERTTFEKEAVWLPLFAMSNIQAGKTLIDGKTFTDCLIEGPAVLMPDTTVVFDSCHMGTASKPENLLLAPVGDLVTGVIGISDCRFVRCRFLFVGFVGREAFREQFAGAVPSLSEVEESGQ